MGVFFINYNNITINISSWIVFSITDPPIFWLEANKFQVFFELKTVSHITIMTQKTSIPIPYLPHA